MPEANDFDPFLLLLDPVENAVRTVNCFPNVRRFGFRWTAANAWKICENSCSVDQFVAELQCCIRISAA
jgi:hypothetical protein